MENTLTLPQTTSIREVFIMPGEDEDEFGNHVRNTNSRKSAHSDSGYSDCNSTHSDQIVEALLDQKQMLQIRVLDLSLENKSLVDQISNLREQLHQAQQQNLLSPNKPRDSLLPDGTSLQQLREEANNLHKTFQRLVTRMSSGIARERESKLKKLESVKAGLDVLFDVVNNRVSTWERDQRAMKHELDSAQVLLEKLENDLNRDSSVMNENVSGVLTPSGLQNQSLKLARKDVPPRKRKFMEVVSNSKSPAFPGEKRKCKSILENLLRADPPSKETGSVNTSESNPVQIDKSLLKIPPLPSLHFPLGSLPPVMTSREDTESLKSRQASGFTIGANIKTHLYQRNAVALQYRQRATQPTIFT